jgi:hypothetical protein
MSDEDAADLVQSRRPDRPPVFVREQYLITKVTVEVDGVWISAEDAQSRYKDSYGAEFFVITAWNPWCEMTTLVENLAKNLALAERLDRAKCEYLLARGQGRLGNWPAEESFAVWGLRDKAIKQIARDFFQEAVFVISANLQTITSTEPTECWVRSMAHDEAQTRFRGLYRSLRDVLISDGGFDEAKLKTVRGSGGWVYLHDFFDGVSKKTYAIAHDQLSTDKANNLTLVDRALQVELGPSETAEWLRRRMTFEFELAQACQDAADRELIDGKYQIYVIEFDDLLPNASAGQRCVYVGESVNSPEHRFAQHKDPESKIANKRVQKYACRLNPDLYLSIPKARTRRESRAIEAKTAEILRRQGFYVIGGH